MAKMFYKDQVPAGESTSGMSLVRNRTDTAKTVSSDGHVLGGREVAWITSDDPVLIASIDKGILRLFKMDPLKTDKVQVAEVKSVEMNISPIPASNNTPMANLPQKTNPPARKKKTKK